MTTALVTAAGCLSIAAAVVAAPPRPARRRLRSLDSFNPAPRVPARRVPETDAIRASSALAGIATGVLVGGWLGAVAGLIAGLALDRALRRIEPRAVRAERLRAAADLPLAADLLSAALRAGAPVDRAVAAVGAALAGPLGERLQRVARALRLGAGAEEAWRHLVETPGSGGDRVRGEFAVTAPAGCERLAKAAIRSAGTGAGMAAVLGRLADELRASRAAGADAAARRAGVLVVLPLGLCFLPAFILAGLVPVIVAVLGDVL